MHNHASAGYECPFCAFVDGVENDFVRLSHIVDRDADTLTFVAPTWWTGNEGHLLVIPTAHVENLYDLPDHLAVPLQRATQRAALALKAAYRCDGTSTRQHNEPAGYQEVWHYHVHVFPRYDGDDLYAATRRPATWAEMDERATMLRPAFARL